MNTVMIVFGFIIIRLPGKERKASDYWGLIRKKVFEK